MDILFRIFLLRTFNILCTHGVLNKQARPSRRLCKELEAKLFSFDWKKILGQKRELDVVKQFCSFAAFF